MNILTLSISNLAQLQHGVVASHRFDRQGGTLGSGAATWPMLDKEQQIRPIHCEVRWIEGSFCVIDHCARTFLNDSSLSLEPFAPVRLQDGDVLRVGAYRLQVRYPQEPGQDDTQGRCLETLFDSNHQALATLLAGAAVNPWHTEPAGVDAVIDICDALDSGIGADPLAALDAALHAEAAPKCPLQRFITGEQS